MKIEEYLSAMKKRCSRRKYTNRPIDSKYVQQLDDALLPKLARDVAKMIEEQMEYPGQIKVNILRETRTVDYAR